MQIEKVNKQEAYIVKKGQRVFFDVKDIPIVRKYSWYVSSNGYARSWCNGVHCSMPELLFDRKTSYIWNFDHLNQDKLDNRRCNLKFCHAIENNARRSIANNTGMPGLHWNGSAYRVRDRVTGKHRSIRDYYDAVMFNMLSYLQVTGDFEGAIEYIGFECDKEQRELLRHTLLLYHMKQAQELEEA